MSAGAIREAINKITGNHMADRVYAVDGIVLSVNPIARVCSCEIVNGRTNAIFDEVRLMANVDDGFLISPTVGSNVTIIFSDFTLPYIAQYSGIDKIIFRGGDLGGLVKVEALTTKLNNLENKVNSLLGKYNIHVHPVIAVGSLSGVTPLVESGILTPTIRLEIENSNISHG
jgi:hypothetical protein